MILFKILKLNNLFFQYLSQIFKESIAAANFPNELKYADVTPVYKKVIDTKKGMTDALVLYPLYRKILERCLYDQIYKNIDNTLSRHQTGYGKIKRKNVVLYLWIYLKHLIVCSMIYY